MEYEFNREDVLRFVNTVGAKTHVKGDELVFDICPICRAKDKNTFSINLRTGQCQCMRAKCSYKGNMITLAREFEDFDLGRDVSAYYNIKNYNSKFKKFKDYKPKTEVKAIEYMKSRGISEDVTKKYGLTVKKGASDILVFPFVNEKGDLKYIKYRNTKYVKGVSEGSKEWSEKDCMPILFGMYQCDIATRHLIITEGQIDSLSVSEAGYSNAVSVPSGKNGFTWIPHCWNFIEQYDEIIVFGDKESDGMTLLDDISRRFYKKKIRHVRLEDYRDCKDANEILLKYGKAQIKTCIENAELIPVNGLIDFSDIKPINRYDIKKLPTGFSQLDKLLCGGLPFGTVVDITGKTGEGKSTLGSWLIAQAIENGHKCFVYSGELDKSLFKEGLDRQLAGERVIAESKDDYEIYTISEDDQEKINHWYKGKGYFYDIYSLSIEESESIDSTLINKIEDSCNQYGTDVFLIDNLMTAMEIEQIEAKDKYEKQSKFMKRLVNMAIRYGILIILVAHNRKDSSGSQNDNISGTADISNLASVTIDYSKAEKPKEIKGKTIHPTDVNGQEIRVDQRVLKLGKNRFFSKLCMEGWCTEYDIKTNRIYINADVRDKKFSWVSDQEGFEEIDNLDEIPF